MKRFIRNKKTLQYLKSDGLWTNDIKSAMVFADAMCVNLICMQRKLEDVEAVLVIGEQPSPHDIIVPLPYLDPSTGRPWLPTQ